MAAQRPFLLLIGVAVVAAVATALIALVVATGRYRIASASPIADRVPMPVVDGDPVFAEAEVFRTRPGMLAIDPTPDRRRAAHPRSLATYRSLRAYPGAPPRIPHGLTPAEALRGGCNTCHERGGFSQRFGAYVPLTPHPEMGACLQCHVGDAKLMPTPLPGPDPSARCRQCHAAGATLWRDTANWRPLAWPALAEVRGADAPPPPIPHSLELRGNCLACHTAPSGVAEIRTDHPERANCRQCHVETNPVAGEFTRPVLRRRTRDDAA